MHAQSTGRPQAENPSWYGPPEPSRLVAFHPDDVEHWYVDARTCETARAEAGLRLARDPRSEDRLGLHDDCFGAIHR